ncbi:uncharacterized protein LOC136042086 [Artemia franciscana]|uniref:uncharacterized protein LOC136042086 n=1 Tax=Artemia franciscana TaxID=6661 RepID=UPI0032DAA947
MQLMEVKEALCPPTQLEPVDLSVHSSCLLSKKLKVSFEFVPTGKDLKKSNNGMVENQVDNIPIQTDIIKKEIFEQIDLNFNTATKCEVTFSEEEDEMVHGFTYNNDCEK